MENDNVEELSRSLEKVGQQNDGRPLQEARQMPPRREAVRRRNPVLMHTLVIILAVLLLAVLLLAVRYFDDTKGSYNSTEPTGNQSGGQIVATTASIRVEIPFFTEEQYLVGTGVVAYMESDLSEDVAKVMGQYRSSTIRMDAGYPVTLSYDVTGIPVGYRVEDIRIEVAEDASFTNARVLEPAASERSVKLYHLKTGMQYYYRITLTVSDGAEVAVQGTFVTANTPRILSIDGIVNVRDIGGWTTESGQTVRQGMLYRGSEMDGQVEPAYVITEKGVQDMVQVLGIRTEMDLRYNILTNSLGDSVEHRSYATEQYELLLQEENNEKVRKLFADFADPAVYPAYVHCTYGWDRTGTVCCLLEALLGMREEDIIREQELSALYHGGANTEALEAFLAQIKTYEGDTLQQCAESYLLSVGVTEEEIQSIRSILLTD